jgi:hypothetical protein
MYVLPEEPLRMEWNVFLCLKRDRGVFVAKKSNPALEGEKESV